MLFRFPSCLLIIGACCRGRPVRSCSTNCNKAPLSWYEAVMKNILFPVLLLAALKPLAAADKVVGGPIVVNATSRTATVVWVVQSDEVVMKAQDGSESHTAPALRAESVKFTGLKAGTSYEYSVPGKEALKGTFKTPAPAGKAFEFVVYGDTRTRHDVHRTVVAAILRYSHPEFVLHLGDLVENGGDPALWPIFFDIEGELLRKAAFFPALGNHERHAS